MDVQRTADGAAILEMRIELGGGVMDGDLRRAGELELAAGLERDAADGGEVAQPDRLVAIEERVPAGALADALEQRLDSIVAARRGQDESDLGGTRASRARCRPATRFSACRPRP